MKTKYLLIVVSAVLLAGGCMEEESGIPGRTTLKARLEQSDTKVSIGDVDGKMTWTENDQIAVHMVNGYQLATVDAATGELTIEETETNFRNFYAVYPASVRENGDYGEPDMKITLPASYDISDIVANASGNPGSDFSPLPMVANNDRESGTLYFYHVGGLLRVTLNGVKPATKYVRVSFDKDVTGTYTVANPGTNNPTITTPGTGSNNAVTFTLTSGNELTSGQASGPIVLNVPVPCGSYTWVKVECLNSSNTVIASKTYDEKTRTFQRHHGKKLSSGELAFDFVFGSLRESRSFSPYGQTRTINDGGFFSYKTDGTTTAPVSFTLEYSIDNGTTWSTTAPSWLTPGVIDMDGSVTGMDIEMTARESPTAEVDEHHDELVKSERAKANFDLSLVNVATFDWINGTPGSIRRTANCYVVQGAGSYKFPLVYGNGVDWTKNTTTGINEDAYRAKAGVDGEYRPADGDANYLGSFKDHLDQNITSPYIATQHSGKAMSAVLLWQDVDGLVQVNSTISGSGANAYITFSVPSATITQGNALIAVLVDDNDDNVPETIAWSWHIWVTEEDLTDVKEGSSGYMFAPKNIGFCEGKKEITEERICLVRATQSVSGKTETCTLEQSPNEEQYPGSSLFFQWGRKDPQWASNGTGNNPGATTPFKVYYPTSPDYAPKNYAEDCVTIGKAIQHPFQPYTVYDAQINGRKDWCVTTYYNYWNSVINGRGQSDYATPVTKTVYDPSPVGYEMPPQDAFSSYTLSTCTFDFDYDLMMQGMYTSNGLFFPCEGRGFYAQDRIYAREVGTEGYYWSANPYNDHYSIGMWLYYDYGSSDSIDNGHATYRDNGCSVRPVKE